MVKDLVSTLKFIFNHPVTRKHKWSAFRRFAGWQLQSRTFHRPIVYPFVENSRLLVQGGMAGATGNIYTGLHEFEDMMFLLHFLRPGDLFTDVGSNIGSYTVLASAVVGASSIAFEPVPSTFLHLKHNIAVNNIESLVELCNAGAGSEKGSLRFTSSFDTTNHVITNTSDTGTDTINVDIITLDERLGNKIPALIKIDAEGFELSVLQGAGAIIRNPSMLAMIIEINGCCQRYDVQEKEIHDWVLNQGFSPVDYDPFSRKYIKRTSFNPHGNTIYIKNEAEVTKRLESARKFNILKEYI